eukprot:TRINITY_DN2385_c0_g1_i1.p1 TRINITY_DN2385_c0_g1~~TRINITY_DN2385_c0_g1_i1.p1  ORF type:complete len:240 (+),score=67.72 TRINITY_DN2385_c0_g1_i1:3-722(+)
MGLKAQGQAADAIQPRGSFSKWLILSLLVITIFITALQSYRPAIKPASSLPTTWHAAQQAGCQKPHLRIVIMSFQRSGTHWLQSLINLHPQLKITSEPFDGADLARIVARHNLRRPSEITPAITLAEIHRRVIYPGYDGYILQHNQMVRFPWLLDQIVDQGFVIVHLHRRNYLEMFMSHKLRDISKEFDNGVFVGKRRKVVAQQMLDEMNKIQSAHHQIALWLKVELNPPRLDPIAFQA